MRNGKRKEKKNRKPRKLTRQRIAVILESINSELDTIVRNNKFGAGGEDSRYPGYDLLSPGNPEETARTAIALALHFRATQPDGLGPALNHEPETVRMVDWAWELMPQREIALLQRRHPSIFRSLLSRWMYSSEFVYEVGN